MFSIHTGKLLCSVHLCMAVQCGTQWPEQETNVYWMAMFKKGENKPSKSKKKSGISIPNYHTSWKFRFFGCAVSGNHSFPLLNIISNLFLSFSVPKMCSHETRKYSWENPQHRITASYRHQSEIYHIRNIT